MRKIIDLTLAAAATLAASVPALADSKSSAEFFAIAADAQVRASVNLKPCLGLKRLRERLMELLTR
jgi:hypothetical protein